MRELPIKTTSIQSKVNTTRPEPKTIKVIADEKFCLNNGLNKRDIYKCIIQNREPKDLSKIVYIKNPLYNGNIAKSSPLLALTKDEYEVIS